MKRRTLESNLAHTTTGATNQDATHKRGDMMGTMAEDTVQADPKYYNSTLSG